MRDRRDYRRRSASRSRSRSKYYTSSEDESRYTSMRNRDTRRKSGTAIPNDSSRKVHIGGPGDVLQGITKECVSGLVPPPYEVEDVLIKPRSEADGGSYVVMTFMSARDAVSVIEKLDGILYKNKRLRVRNVDGDTGLHERRSEINRFKGKSTDRPPIKDGDRRSHIMAAMSRNDSENGNSIVSQYIRISHLWKVGDQLLHERGEDEFFSEIWDDVKDEVRKFSCVVKHWVDRLSEEGVIYMELDKPGSARNAIHALNGRWFAGNQIRVESMSQAEWSFLLPKFMLDIA